ncbi:MAG: hypothetical protein LBW85_02230 [Deltaproteobacteria bacterium]|nr:hypothetical protein [Deltaproteobacteria bacterium]
MNLKFIAILAAAPALALFLLASLVSRAEAPPSGAEGLSAFQAPWAGALSGTGLEGPCLSGDGPESPLMASGRRPDRDRERDGDRGPGHAPPPPPDPGYDDDRDRRENTHWERDDDDDRYRRPPHDESRRKRNR